MKKYLYLFLSIFVLGIGTWFLLVRCDSHENETIYTDKGVLKHDSTKYMEFRFRYIVNQRFTIKIPVCLTSSAPFEVDWCDGVETVYPETGFSNGYTKVILEHTYPNGFLGPLYNHPHHIVLKTENVVIMGIQGDVYEKRDVNVVIANGGDKPIHGINLVNPDLTYDHGLIIGPKFLNNAYPDSAHWYFSEAQIQKIKDNKTTEFAYGRSNFVHPNILEFMGLNYANGSAPPPECWHTGNCWYDEGPPANCCCHCPTCP